MAEPVGAGQPALVLTYCATGNSHDQYFFRRQELMVSGAVSLPRLDLANEDLVRAHAHALWLAETEQYLGDSFTEILDVEGVSPSLELKSGPRVEPDQEDSPGRRPRQDPGHPRYAER